MVGLHFTILSETPCAEPHAGCCGGWGLETSGYPIMYGQTKTPFITILGIKKQPASAIEPVIPNATQQNIACKQNTLGFAEALVCIVSTASCTF
jgi:hypothetical protein